MALYLTKPSVTTSTQQTGDSEWWVPGFLADLHVHDRDLDLHEMITCFTIFRLFPPACYAADLLALNIIFFIWYADPADIHVFFDSCF